MQPQTAKRLKRLFTMESWEGWALGLAFYLLMVFTPAHGALATFRMLYLIFGAGALLVHGGYLLSLRRRAKNPS